MRAKLFERELPFDVGLRADRCINQSRPRAREQNARNSAEFADPHRAHWKIDVSPSDEIEQTRELYGRVGACGDLENICAMGFGSAGFGAQHAQRRRRFEIME